jgi:uncharacterized membrane protein YeaQ/YmgE (transglycosylase-associated protein family)
LHAACCSAVQAPLDRFVSTPAHDSIRGERYAGVWLLIAGLARDGVSPGEAIMTIESLIIWLIVGALAGWIAGLIVKGYGLGLIGNIVVGIIGAVIAGWLLPRLGIVIGGGFIAALINAVIGAVILLVIIGLIRR